MAVGDRMGSSGGRGLWQTGRAFSVIITSWSMVIGTVVMLVVIGYPRIG